MNNVIAQCKVLTCVLTVAMFYTNKCAVKKNALLLKLAVGISTSDS